MLTGTEAHGTRLAEQQIRRQSVRALVASSVGTTIEFYDFTLYNITAALYLAPVFFPGHEPFLATLAAFGSAIPGYLARPLGAALFGHYGDRVGRKAMLIMTLVLMGVASAGIGLIPPYAAIGIWAPILLVTFRIVQGLGVSGEWAGAVLISVEWREHHRGWAGSWAQIGVPAGLVFSYLALLTSTSIFGQRSYWGWRLPFLVSLLLIMLGLYVRLGVLETPAFTKVLEAHRQEKWPLVSALRGSSRPLAAAFLLQAGVSTVGLIITTFILAYATGTLKIRQSEILSFVLLGSTLSVGSILFWGFVSDRVGRRRMYVIGAASAALFAVPYWLMVDSRLTLLVLLAVLISMVLRDMQLGPLAAYVADAFPTPVRYTGAGFGYNLGAAVFTGTAPSIALILFHSFRTSMAIALFMIGATLLSMVGASALPDRRRHRLDEDEEAQGIALA